MPFPWFHLTHPLLRDVCVASLHPGERASEVSWRERKGKQSVGGRQWKQMNRMCRKERK